MSIEQTDLEQLYSENALNTYKKLYLRKDENDEVIETISECHERIIKRLQLFPAHKQALDDQIIRINTPCMANAGVNDDECYAACFILGLEDSMDSIIESWTIAPKIYKGGGGCGIPFSNLREQQATVSSGGRASGPLSYMKVIQAESETVKSGGRQRRAANLSSFWYAHPDIIEYVNVKSDKKSLDAFNLSVMVDDEFFHALNKNLKIDLISPKKGGTPTGKTIPAFEIWSGIIKNAWNGAEPGLLFYDRINEDNPFPSKGNIVCVNPCSEVVGTDWTVCMLAHINLNKILDYDANNKCTVNWGRFQKYIRCASDILNQMINISKYPHPNFEKKMKGDRPIGIGTMGFADICYKLGIPYNSTWANEFIRIIQDTVSKTAFEYAIVKAHAFGKVHIPDEDVEHFKKYLKRFNVKEKLIEKAITYGIANSTVSVLAPTGSTAISCDCSYSFEPMFALSFQKHISDSDEVWTFVNPIFEEVCRTNGIELTEDLLTKIKNNKGSIQGLDEFPDKMQKVFVTAHDIHWRDRIALQASAQEGTTMSISSTVNLPNSASIKDVSEVYRYAWEMGLKGITVYRDGCLEDQPIDFGGEKKTNSVPVSEETSNLPPKSRPQDLNGFTRKMLTGSGVLYLTVNFHEGNPFEVFATIGKGGKSIAAKAEAIGRMVSLALRSGVPVDEIVKQLDNIGGDYPVFQEGGLVKSIPDAIARILKDVSEGKYPEALAGTVLSTDETINLETSDPIETPTYQDETFVLTVDRTAYIGSSPIALDPDSICPKCSQPTFRKDGSCRGGLCESCGFSNCQ